MKKNKPDFSGWATRNDLKCTDGRTIRHGAFDGCDGQRVPLVWNHQHNEPYNVLGHAILHNMDEGVYADGYFNDTEQGENAKMLLEHGDISALSIYANQLKQKGGDVLHGVIREVSLVLAGANPGAFIDSVSLSHGEESEEEAIIYTGEPLELSHADKEEEKEKMADEEKKPEEKKEDGKTVKEVFDTLNEEQKTVVYALIGQAMEDAKGGSDDEDDEEDEKMKHNVFDNDEQATGGVLMHSDQQSILELAKTPQVGTFQTALEIYADDNGLQHDALSSGFYQTGQTYNVDALFPEYKNLKPGAPELITNDQGWVGTVLQKVHKSPISRIRTQQVDIRNIDALRAKGYVKGKQKGQTGNFGLVRRETDPQTIYVKSALHRDDIIDITDFDYVQYLYNIDKMQLNEELAMAIMLGDFRADDAEGKISPTHIRPIWTDDDLYTIHQDIDIAATAAELQGNDAADYFGENFIYAEAMINKCLYARENFKGTGTPDMFMTPHMLNVMLLARDRNGRRIYASKAELESALNVGNIYTAEQFANRTRKDSNNAYHKLIAIICNLADYHLGATKGGEVTHFTQFDIDFNQQKSLLETRCSGALTKVYSAIVIEEPVVNGSTGATGETGTTGETGLG